MTYACALALILLAFAFRFITFRGFTNDQFQHLAWAQQMARGALPGRDFLEPGMPLMIAVSALLQRIAPGPFVEALLGEAMLAIAAGVTCLVATEFSGSLLIGVGAALAETGLEPRLYNYPKILIPAVALLLLQYYLRRRSPWRLVLLSAWTVAAFLFRHDLGLIAAAAIAPALAWPAGRTWRETWRDVAWYVAAGLCLVAPYVLWVQTTTGLAEHVRVALEFTKVETHQIILLDAPSLPALARGDLSTWGREDASAFLYWLYQALIVGMATALVVWRRLDDRRRATLTAVLLFMVGYRVMILRYPLAGRIADVATPLSIAALWSFAEARRIAHAMRRTRPAAATTLGWTAAVIAVVGAISIWTQPALGDEVFDQTGLDKGPSGIVRQVELELATRNDVAHYWPAGYPPAALEYIRRCTAPTDRLLLTWSAPEYYVLTGRSFAGTHAVVLVPQAFDTPQDENGMLNGLTNQYVPIVLVNKTELPGFAHAYSRVDRYLGEHYREVGSFTARDGSEIGVEVRADLRGASTYNGWPCGFRSTLNHT